jgi:hypothetical protein
MQRRQGLLRGVVYNLHRLVQLGVLFLLWKHLETSMSRLDSLLA